MKLPRHSVLTVATVAALATVAYAVHQSIPAAATPAPPVPASSPANELRRVAGAGVVEPAGEAIALAPPIAGRVAAVRVRPGDTVRQGDVLLSLDEQTVRAEQRAREAAEQAARRALDTAQEELREKVELLALYRGLEGSDALVREELVRREAALRLAQARLAGAQAGVDEARAAVDLAAAQVTQHTLRAPLDAIVLQVRSRPGEWVQPGGTAPLTLGRLGPLQVRVDIDEADITRLSLGTNATVVARGDSTPVSARFIRAEPLLTPKRSLSNASDERVDTRVLQLLFELPVSAAGFRVGQQVDAFVPAKGASVPGSIRKPDVR